MILKCCMCLISPVLMYVCHHYHCYSHHCHSNNWLEDKRQTVLRQQQMTNELKLEKLRLEAEQKKLEAEQKNNRRDKQAEQIMNRLDELERLLKERTIEATPDRKPALTETKLRPTSDRNMLKHIKNRAAALRLFRAAALGTWVIKNKPITAFPDKRFCEEYLEYECSLPEYCRTFLTELPEGQMLSVEMGQRLNVVSDNSEELLPAEEELKELGEQDTAHFESSGSALTYLQENARAMGMVQFRTESGQTLWATYRDLTAQAEHQVSPVSE